MKIERTFQDLYLVHDNGNKESVADLLVKLADKAKIKLFEAPVAEPVEVVNPVPPAVVDSTVEPAAE